MKSEIIGFTDWLQTPPGAYLLNWERTQFDETVSDIFGYHALQLGTAELDTLLVNRMPHRWLALESLPALPPDHPAGSTRLKDAASTARGSASPAASSRKVAFLTDSGALPFPPGSLDLVVLPHTLELGRDPHATLREVERVLVPEGRVVISGFNPVSLWGLGRRHYRSDDTVSAGPPYLPRTSELIGYWRLRDWLRLLNFEVESARFGCYRPALANQKWLDRFAWMDAAGARWWPIFGAVYFVDAVKRVRGVTLLEPAWKTRKAPAAAPAVVANKNPATTRSARTPRI
ncbi:methyltransferase domain-containing protein [Polaromonas sp.]|uniref:class I SAM-dependent methyltransferase n=1 Tax=Polaromonas sp. TaxID=1869339 RepID=UPI000BCC4305|nr:methyltransferase domain-containing protein [Polaromonas sp.]OYY98532.1 MAG: SAM-dependent methyltransferase [Polaromonas sp. 28-63-22]HQS32115.1 methyltransferase domain-containing protein [Polaromonas sp.]HQS91779.1 methyltransferase domain-containing protein [Polaromonas sp.]